MRIPAPVALGLLTLLAAAAWWLARPDSDGPAALGAVVQPGYYLTGAELEQTDATGRLTLKVHAATARQVEQHGDVSLGQLKVDYLPEPGRDWVMTSVGGTLLPSGKTVLLEGDVRVSFPDKNAAVLRTEHLRLDVDQQRASTDDVVHMQMATNQLSARGMQADLKRENVRLESAVNGTFTR